jgi:hypothetical protein
VASALRKIHERLRRSGGKGVAKIMFMNSTSVDNTTLGLLIEMFVFLQHFVSLNTYMS